MTARHAWLIAALAFALTQPASAGTHRLPRFDLSDVVAGKAIVRFREGSSESRRRSALRAAGARLDRDLMVPGWALVDVAGPLAAGLGALSSQGAIALAEPDYHAHVQMDSPNDPCLSITATPQECQSAPWHLQAIAAQGGWNRFPGRYFSPANPKSSLPAASRIKVAAIDVPVLRGNPDFRNGTSSDDVALGGQLDVAGMTGFPNAVAPESGSFKWHGNYVAGLIAATANNAYATAGVDYAADLLPLAAVHGDSGVADADIVGNAVVYAFAHGARVINLSLGLTSSSSYVNAAIQQVTSAADPPLVVAAGGNNTADQPFYPAWFDNVMAVGGTDPFDRKARCASWSSHIAVSAPARLVPSLGADTVMIAPDCGTSAATPQVSALAALLMAQEPSRTADAVREIIEATADDLGDPGRDDFFGFGRINVDRALAIGLDVPDARGVAATPARPGGGVSTVTARAVSESQIVAAEMFVDRSPTGPTDRGYAMRAADGAFDSSSESLVGQISTGAFAGGTHRVLVRALDANGTWGVLGSAAMYVDSFPPTVASLAASDSIHLLDGGSQIGFVDGDEYSTTLGYDVTVTSALTGAIAWRSDRVVAPAGPQQVTWTPAATDLPGRYGIRVTVRDEAGNSTSATTTVTLV